MALELLSPAGSPEALRAAVQSGCGEDAVTVSLRDGSMNAAENGFLTLSK